MTAHVVMFSGGVGSFATAKRVADEHGPDNMILLVADTRTEAEDWRPFVDNTHRVLGGQLVILDQGKTVWDLAVEQRMIPNTRVDFCSRILKREPLRKWLEENLDPADTVVYLGFDWTEEHRLERARPFWEPWTVAAPLCDPPYRQKAELIAEVKAAGIAVPAAYANGLPHNNCLRGGCVKGGQAYWRQLLLTQPDSYKWAEEQEQRVRDHIEKDVSILRDRRFNPHESGRGAEGVKPLTLKAYRERLQQQPSLFDGEDWGACSCMDDQNGNTDQPG